ncbi:MAG: hypothetical protein CFE46_06160 [Burkholderiales bacterium PBB6]|nr:MAG: hypothetical protein CFE46_06160 [Burkholderiales bacterium PBB6]
MSLHNAPVPTQEEPSHSSNTAWRRGLVAIFAATFFELTGLFLFNPLLLFTLKGAGWSDAAVGLVAASSWLGLALATPFTAGWVARLGLRGALIASGIVPFFALLLMALTPWPLGWAALSMAAGAAGALRWIVAEATVAELAPDHRRGRIVGLFETMVGVTFIAGPALLAWLGTDGTAANTARWLAVGLSGTGLLLSLAVPHLHTHKPTDGSAAPRLGLRGIADAMRAQPVLMVAGAVGGFFEAGTSGVLPLYGLSMGFAAAAAALLVSASGLGSALAMVPIGELSDRWSHRKVFLACASLNLLATLALPLVPLWSPAAALIAFVWGGAGGALYTLAMIDIGHRQQGVQLVTTTAVLVLSYTVGGMCAPVLGGLALTWAPGWGLPVLMSTTAAAGLLALHHHLKRTAPLH